MTSCGIPQEVYMTSAEGTNKCINVGFSQVSAHFIHYLELGHIHSLNSKCAIDFKVLFFIQFFS